MSFPNNPPSGLRVAVVVVDGREAIGFDGGVNADLPLAFVSGFVAPKVWQCARQFGRG
jgi:hypothetical protein